MRTQVLIALELVVMLVGSNVASFSRASAQRGHGATTESSRSQDHATADEAARWLFNTAREAFEAGDYEAALQRFRDAYQLSARPALLYNIGTTLDRLRRDAEAVVAFEQYLALVPRSPNRSEIEARMTVLRQAIERARNEDSEHARFEAERRAAEQARLEAEARAARAEQQTSEGIPSWALWTVAGAGGGALVGAIITEIVTSKRNDDYEAFVLDQVPGTEAYEHARDLYDDARTMRNVSISLYCLTAAFAAGAGAMVPFTRWGDDEDDPSAPSGQAGLSIGQGALTLDLRHRF